MLLSHLSSLFTSVAPLLSSLSLLLRVQNGLLLELRIELLYPANSLSL